MKLLLLLILALSAPAYAQDEEMDFESELIMSFVNRCGTENEGMAWPFLEAKSMTHTLAAYHFGLMHKDGTCGLGININEAKKLLAYASRDIPDAMYQYALILQSDGSYSYKDEVNELMLRAAKLKHPEAMLFTGKRSLKKNSEDTSTGKYLTLAAQAGIEEAYIWAASYYERIGDKLSLLRLLNEGHKKEIDAATTILFVVYAGNRLKIKNLRKANEVASQSYIKKSTAGYRLHAITHLFKMANGSNDEQAFFDLIKASRKGDFISQRLLACMYFDGLYKKRDPQQANYWFKKSEELDLDEKDKILAEAQLKFLRSELNDDWPFKQECK